MTRTWFGSADEAYRLIGQARTVTGLHLAHPFPQTAAGGAAIAKVTEALETAERQLRAAYRAEAAAQKEKE